MPDPAKLRVRCRAAIGPVTLDVDFTTAASWTVLFGASGSGKSSLLRLIAGLWQPADAEVGCGGERLTRLPAYRRRVGFVQQQPALFPHMDVLSNVRFGCHAGGGIDEVLRLFDLHQLRSARVQHLSGGERQRVAMARALAAAPRLLLLDEVFTGMHLQQRDDLLRRVQAHCAHGRIPVLSVTHDAIEAGLVADEVLKLDAGRIVARGTAEEVLQGERAALRRALAALSLS